MNTVNELRDAIASKQTLVWKDPDRNPEMDPEEYIISTIEAIEDDFEDDREIYIEYNEGFSQAYVWLDEIEIFEKK